MASTATDPSATDPSALNRGYELFWASGTACLAPQMVLEEIGLPYEIVEVDLTRGAHRSDAFLAMNPVGTLPVLRLPEGQLLTESAAISLYLAERHPAAGLAPAPGDPARGPFLRALFYLTNTVQVAYKRYYYPERFSRNPEHAEGIRDQAADDLAAVWRPVETYLSAGGPYHLGAAFSLADLYMLMLSTWFEPIGDLPALCPAVAAACEELRHRPAVRKCLAMQQTFSIGVV